MNASTHLQQALTALRAERDRIDSAIGQVEDMVSQLDGKPSAPPNLQPPPTGWTPERRAAQAKKIKAVWAKKRKAAAEAKKTR